MRVLHTFPNPCHIPVLPHEILSIILPRRATSATDCGAVSIQRGGPCPQGVWGERITETPAIQHPSDRQGARQHGVRMHMPDGRYLGSMSIRAFFQKEHLRLTSRCTGPALCARYVSNRATVVQGSTVGDGSSHTLRVCGIFDRAEDCQDISTHFDRVVGVILRTNQLSSLISYTEDLG